MTAAFISLSPGSVGLAEAPEGRYEILADTVKDLNTGLIWQRFHDCKMYNWSDAKEYCQSLGQGWRLPALKELLTLVDPTRTTPSIDPNAFPDTLRDYWTASPSLRESPEMTAWAVNFNGGGTNPYNGVDRALPVRCVR